MTKVEVSPKVLWGKVITRLRDKKLPALHIACGDVSDLRFENEKLVAYTDQEYLYSMISKEENFEEITKAIDYLGYKFKFEIKLKEKQSEKINKDIEKLKSYVNEYLKIIKE